MVNRLCSRGTTKEQATILVHIIYLCAYTERRAPQECLQGQKGLHTHRGREKALSFDFFLTRGVLALVTITHYQSRLPPGTYIVACSYGSAPEQPPHTTQQLRNAISLPLPLSNSFEATPQHQQRWQLVHWQQLSWCVICTRPLSFLHLKP